MDHWDRGVLQVIRPFLSAVLIQLLTFRDAQVGSYMRLRPHLFDLELLLSFVVWIRVGKR